MSLIKFLLKQILSLFPYLMQRITNHDHRIKFYNFWQSEKKNFWFKSFIEDRACFNKYDKIVISFYSVFGSYLAPLLDNSKINFFYTGENINHFPDSLLLKNGAPYGIDLGIGFDYRDQKEYVRFPHWLLTFLKPYDDFKTIQSYCSTINNTDSQSRSYFASLIARHDRNGLRKQMVDTLTEIDFIHCAGPIYNNTSLLRTKYNEDKISFLKNFKFNICPENSNASGYVTEKLFEAFMAGCIPVYWGSDNNPEPGIINPEAVIFWNSQGNNEASVALIEDLHRNEKRRKEFLNQKRLLPSAPDNIYKMLHSLECKLASCINTKLKN